MLILIFIFIFSTLKTASAAYKEEIFNEWVYDEGNFTAGEKTFYTTVNARLNLVSIKHGEDKTIVTMAECKDAFGFNFCFSDKEIWYHDALDRDYYKAKIVVYEYLGKLNINRTFSSTDLLINERARVDIRIENVGSLPATNIDFTDAYANEFLISDNENCVISGNSIKWRGNIDVGSKIKCSYYIKPLKKIKYNSQASVKYYNGKRTAIDSSSVVKLDVPDHRLKIIANISRKRINIEEDTVLYINFSNLHKKYSLNVLNLRVDIPLGLEVVSKGALLKRAEDYVSMVSVPFIAGTSKDSYIEFRGKRSGLTTVTADVKYEINSVTAEFQINLTEINITVEDLQFYLHVPTVMEAGKSYRVNVSVNNPSENYEYKNIRTYLKTDVPGLEEKDFGIVNWLDRRKQQNIAFYYFTIPQTKGRKSHYVTLEAYYLTVNGEYLKQKITNKVEVIGEPILVNETIVKANETTAVNVSQEKPVVIDIPKTIVIEKREIQTNRLIISFIAIFIIADVFLVMSIIKKIKKE